MKILHTADFHLRAEGDIRWQTLQRVLERARDEDVSLVAISGDLFDRGINAHKLKGPLRDLFQNHTFPIFIIPGNHDVGALKESDYYGENVAIMQHADRYIDVEGVRLFALPFENIEGEQVLERLFTIRNHRRSEACNIVLYHGELLDVMFSRDDFGDEEATAYMPVKLSYFDGLGIDYVLAGHFHTNFEVQRFKDGYFVYPGSPLSITRKETGIRKVNLFEPGHEPRAVELDTPHYEVAAVKLSPFNDVDPTAALRERVAGCHRNARLLLDVAGFVDLSRMQKTESEFAAELRTLMTPQVEKMSERWRDIGVVLENDIFKRCMIELDRLRLDEGSRDRVRGLIIESVMEAVGEN